MFYQTEFEIITKYLKLGCSYDSLATELSKRPIQSVIMYTLTNQTLAMLSSNFV